MAITRTPIVDDDGSGTTGTVIDNSWKQQLYDQIDGVTGSIPAPLRLGALWHGGTPGGQIDNWDLGSLGAYTAFIMTPVGTATVTGIKAVTSGTMYLLVNASAFTITLAHYHTGSIAANRFFGPGNASYVMTPWLSVWVLYDSAQPAWIVLKP